MGELYWTANRVTLAFALTISLIVSTIATIKTGQPLYLASSAILITTCLLVVLISTFKDQSNSRLGVNSYRKW